MIPHQNNHLKVAVVKKAFSKQYLKMSCAQNIISDFKDWNTWLKPAPQITPFRGEYQNIQATTSRILEAPTRKVKYEKSYSCYRDFKEGFKGFFQGYLSID